MKRRYTKENDAIIGRSNFNDKYDEESQMFFDNFETPKKNSNSGLFDGSGGYDSKDKLNLTEKKILSQISSEGNSNPFMREDKASQLEKSNFDNRRQFKLLKAKKRPKNEFFESKKRLINTRKKRNQRAKFCKENSMKGFFNQTKIFKGSQEFYGKTKKHDNTEQPGRIEYSSKRTSHKFKIYKADNQVYYPNGDVRWEVKDMDKDNDCDTDEAEFNLAVHTMHINLNLGVTMCEKEMSIKPQRPSNIKRSNSMQARCRFNGF